MTPRVRSSISSGTDWERIAGFSRALRIGDRILVSGTTATDSGGVVGAGDAAAQTRYILDKIATAIGELGGSWRDIVRTRIYVRYIEDWEPVARVHGDYLGAIRPANTLVQAQLVGDDYLVEIEAEAVIGAGDAI